jgi:hypothetical protein
VVTAFDNAAIQRYSQRSVNDGPLGPESDPRNLLIRHDIKGVLHEAQGTASIIIT